MRIVHDHHKMMMMMIMIMMMMMMMMMLIMMMFMKRSIFNRLTHVKLASFLWDKKQNVATHLGLLVNHDETRGPMVL